MTSEVLRKILVAGAAVAALSVAAHERRKGQIVLEPLKPPNPG